MIITFYSYKGGVGRSMALANVAEWLFRQGLRVVVVDWDLEAPGIESYFAPDEEARRALSGRRGVVDLLVGYQAIHETLVARSPAELSGTTPLSPEAKLKSISDILPSLAFSLQPLEDSPGPVVGGREAGLWLLSAGARGEKFEQYADHVHSFDWAAFYLKRDGALFFRWLRTELEKFADVVLVDSRTGVTEMSGVCTRDLADLVVSFCAPNDSNLNGVIRMTQWFLDPKLPSLRDGRPLRAMIVPTRVDGKAETAELAKFRRKFLEHVGKLHDPQGPVDAEAWWELQIGYVSLYSFYERIVIGRRQESEYLQKDLERLSADLARRFVAHADGAGVDLSGRKFGSALHELVTAGVDAGDQAENALQRIPEAERARALSLLTRLVKVARADEGGAITAIRVPTAVFDEASRTLLDKLVESGLLRAIDNEDGLPCVELRYQAVASDWNRLRSFVRAERDFILWRQQLDGYLNTYRSRGARQELLLSGELLSEAKRQRTARSEDLTKEEHDFIESSSLAESAATAVNKRARVLRAVAVVAFLALLTGWIAFSSVRENARERDIAEIAALQSEADAALGRDDYLGAIARLDRALTLAPRDANLLLKRGSAKVTASRLPGREPLLTNAIADLDSSIAIDPTQAQAFRARADALQRRRQSDDLDRADRDLTRAIELDSNSAEYVLERARLRESRNQVATALQDYTAALKIVPDSSDAYYSRGLLYVSDGKSNQAGEDFRKVVSLSSDPALVAAANVQLEKLGQSTVMARKPRVLIHYNYGHDAGIVDRLQAALASNELEVASSQLTDIPARGDVRYFFQEDRATAANVANLTERVLATEGVRRKLDVIYVDSKSFSKAQRGQLELWLPPLTADLATVKVEVFWCTSSGEPAREIAERLVKQRNPGWRGRWKVEELAPSRNAQEGYRISGIQIRVSSEAEIPAGQTLQKWVMETLKTDVRVVRTKGYDSQNYLSVFVCPAELASSSG